MTDAELWLSVGRVLAAKRQGLGYSAKTVGKALAKPGHRALNVGTVRAIENGEPKNIGALNEYCVLLGLRMTEVIASVLPRAEASAETMRVARQYERAPELSQRAVRAVLDAVPPARATPPDDGKPAPAKKPSRSERGR